MAAPKPDKNRCIIHQHLEGLESINCLRYNTTRNKTKTHRSKQKQSQPGNTTNATSVKVRNMTNTTTSENPCDKGLTLDIHFCHPIHFIVCPAILPKYLCYAQKHHTIVSSAT
ncbi:hypothetical protein QL285_002530 [Trifolium repens]|nr:hypothetical protein QL285_002530 [Trifolium repens]